MQEQEGRIGNLTLHRSSGSQPEPLRRPSTRTIAVVSGKGGVGKTTFATNLALALERSGRRTLLVDGDWGMANVDLLLGLHPSFTLHHVVLGDRSIREIVLETEEGLQVLPGAAGVEEMVNLDDLSCERLLCSLVELEDRCDLILFDTSSGVGRTTTHLARAADEIIVVTTPEPTATTDAYACLSILGRRNPKPNLRLVINRVEDAAEARDVAERMRSVARRFLDLDPEFLVTCSRIQRSAHRCDCRNRFFEFSPDAQRLDVSSGSQRGSWPRRNRSHVICQSRKHLERFPTWRMPLPSAVGAKRRCRSAQRRTHA